MQPYISQFDNLALLKPYHPYVYGPKPSILWQISSQVVDEINLWFEDNNSKWRHHFTVEVEPNSYVS